MRIHPITSYDVFRNILHIIDEVHLDDEEAPVKHREYFYVPGSWELHRDVILFAGEIPLKFNADTAEFILHEANKSVYHCDTNPVDTKTQPLHEILWYARNAQFIKIGVYFFDTLDLGFAIDCFTSNREIYQVKNPD